MATVTSSRIKMEGFTLMNLIGEGPGKSIWKVLRTMGTSGKVL